MHRFPAPFPSLKHFSAMLLSVWFGLMFTGCESDATDPAPDPKARQLLASLSVSEREIIRSDNGFGFKLFARLADAEQGNLFVSPLSVSILLTMAYNGARGTTESEMGEMLGYGGMERAAVNSLYARLIPALLGADPKVTLKFANSIWSAPRLSAEKDFLDLNRDTFAAEIGTLDFTEPQAATVINKWTSDKTGGLIDKIVEPPLDPNLVMVLLNALYFKGDWSGGFNPKATYDTPFHLADGSEKSCRMMNKEGFFFHFTDGGVNGVELPYGDSLFSMVMLQPLDSAGLPELIESLRDGAWTGWEGKLAPKEGMVRIPKFKLEFGKSLVEDLQALGMKAAFSDTADFTGIQRSGGLKVSEVKHKTYVSVDEVGTEAAAVTLGGIVDKSMPMDLIRLDRPFVVLIREKSSGTVLFVGRIMDPTL